MLRYNVVTGGLLSDQNVYKNDWSRTLMGVAVPFQRIAHVEKLQV